ncbi:MAG: ATP-dependent Clp protease proteolytic subunit [Candidatus Adlerbacteria bacterium]|nr:ATP-dependent Clp protease proteolytic subunit [Candidatus Adlerbacteria bacterium]
MHFAPEHVAEYLGVVNYATNERVLNRIKEHMLTTPNNELYLTVTSAGGPSGTAMGFYDTVRSILRPRLVTIGAGDVDSSGMIIFLSGDVRYITAHTTALLHLAGRTFANGQRFTATEMSAMLEEDRIKDTQYASIVAEHSHGKLTPEQVLEMMKNNTVLTPVEFVKYGLAQGVLGATA